MVTTGGLTVLSNDLWKFCSGMTNYEGKRRPNAVYANIAYNMHQTLPTALTIIRNKRSSTIANSCIGRGNVPIDTGCKGIINTNISLVQGMYMLVNFFFRSE